MQGEIRTRSMSRGGRPARGEPASGTQGARGDPEGRPARDVEAERSRSLVACLTQAIDARVIPQLAARHGIGRPAPNPPHEGPAALPRAADVEAFLRHVIAGHSAEMAALVSQLRQTGCSVESVYLDLLKPTARRMGELWCDDDLDFAQVTLACGHLQRLMRELSPEFAAEVEAAPHAHRALFVQADGEQHGFGLSMLAEFFRRAGWDVLGGVGTASADPAERVRREWVDLVGLSVGSVPKLAWTRQAIERIRAASMNRHVVVMVGGPVFHAHPHLRAEVPADGTATHAGEALHLAERLVALRQAEAAAHGHAAANGATTASPRRVPPRSAD